MNSLYELIRIVRVFILADLKLAALSSNRIPEIFAASLNMKRSVSRASKVSNEIQDTLENCLPGIPEAKWHEFLKKEDTEIFILGLREEILQKCLELCFENYLEKQAITFTVHCAYLAWCRTLNMYYMFRDPGDEEEPKIKESWEPDLEPEPSIIDSWGSKCIRSMSPVQPPTKKEKESRKTMSDSVASEPETLQSCSFVSDFFNAGEGEVFFYSNSSRTSATSSAVRKQSIFTRTLSMSRDSLPLVEPVTLFKGCAEDAANDKKRKTTKTAKH